MAIHDPYVLELAATVKTLFGAGVNDPSAEEIAEAHFPKRALGNEIIDGIRKRLRKVRDVLEGAYELPVYLLNQTYYLRYREEPPPTDDAARKCIPGGYHVVSAGIRMHKNGNKPDLIWEATIRQNMVSGAGKVKKSAHRTLDAVTARLAQKPRAARLLASGQPKMEPKQRALAAKVMRALPKPKSKQK